jgi:outer membrane PBP1 activator LpoA protein
VAPQSRTDRLALLLPLSGAQRTVAEAIRDGFLAAYLADAAAGKPGIMILDEEHPGAVDAYRAAIAAGARTVVGPLLKESVVQVATVAGSVPTLTLNYLDAAGPLPRGFYQFSLAPEDEARQAAARAVSEGRMRAIALAPDSEWGRRVLNAFTSALEERGGKLLAYRYYDAAATDFTAPIQRLLLLDESRERQRRLSANLGVPLEFEPRRRSDMDCIFLAANVATGRLIRPQLRFLYAGDVPTYATSAVYQAGARGDADLDGVMFADAPAVLGSDSRAQALRQEIARRWPAGAVSRMRLYAMGFDAYGLARSAPPAANGVAGLSGWLSMDDAGRIHRTLPWAEFRDGGIVLLPDVGPSGPAAALTPQ